jgi:ATP-binding cassette, subfamily B (MDR/TAP), member 1
MSFASYCSLTASGIGSFVLFYITIFGFNYVGERITRRIRKAYIAAVLRQNIAFFDFIGAGEVTARITSDLNLVQDALSEKVGVVLGALSSFVAALVIAFIKYWKLAFILLSGTILMIFAMGGLGGAMKKVQTQALASAATSSNLAEETISSIRNVSAFGMQKRIIDKFEQDEKVTRRLDMKAKVILGVMLASAICIMMLLYGLAFWQGGRFISWGDINLSQLLTVVMASLIGGAYFGQMA